MKTLKFISYLFYRYYSKGGTKYVPYFSTLCAIAMIILLHIFQLLVIFNGMNLFPSGATPGSARLIRYLEMGLLLVPLFLLLSVLIKKRELQSLQYDESKIKQGSIYLISYIVLSVALLVFLIFLKKGKLG